MHKLKQFLPQKIYLPHTMKLSDKGPIKPPPTMPGLLGDLVETIQKWPGVISATHWDLYRPSVADGADFYIGDTEIGHIHFDGEAHVATDAQISQSFIEQGKAQPFRYRADPTYRHWTQVKITNPTHCENTLALFRANYERLTVLARPVTC